MTLAVLRASLRLTLRSVWPWVVTLVTGLLLLALGSGGNGPHVMSWLAHQAVVPFGLFFLGQMLAVTFEAQRERSARMEETLGALPLRAAPWVIGRVGGIYLVWLAASGVVWFAGPIAGLFAGGALNAFLFWDWLWLMPAGLAFSTAAAYTIGTVIRRGLAAYALTLLLYLTLSFMGLQMLTVVSGEMLRSGPPVLLDFQMGLFFPISAAAPFPDLWPLIYNRAHAVAVALFWGGALTWRLGARRREPGLRWARVATFAGLTLVALVFLCSRFVWIPRVEMYRAEVAAYRESQPVAGRRVATPAVSAYDVHLTLDPKRPGLSASAAMDLAPAGDTAIFTLNRNFAVQYVRGPGGEEVAFDREDDLLTIATAGRSGRYVVAYTGQVWQWREDGNKRLRLAAHVAQGSAMLPAGLGWYPLPGHQLLALPDPAAYSVIDGPVGHTAVPFQLEVAGVPGLHVLTNAGRGEPVTAAWVLATPYEAVKTDPMTAYVSPDNRPGAVALANRFSDLSAYWNLLLPQQRPLELVEIPDTLWYSRITWQPTAGFAGDLVLASSQIAKADGMLMSQFLIKPWWGESRTDEERQIQEVLGAFMLERYAMARNQGKLNTVYVSIGVPYGATTASGRVLTDALHQYANANGMEATGRLLERLRTLPGPLTWQQAVTTIKGEAP